MFGTNIFGKKKPKKVKTLRSELGWGELAVRLFKVYTLLHCYLKKNISTFHIFIIYMIYKTMNLREKE